MARQLTLQSASNLLMSLVHPRVEDIRMAKEYKRRIHGDVGGSWVLRAHPDTPIEKPTLLYPAKGMSGLESQTKMEIITPQVSSLQIGSSKVHLNSEIPLDTATASGLEYYCCKRLGNIIYFS